MFQLQLKTKTSLVCILTFGWKSVEDVEALQSFTGLSEPIIVSQAKNLLNFPTISYNELSWLE